MDKRKSSVDSLCCSKPSVLQSVDLPTPGGPLMMIIFLMSRFYLARVLVHRACFAPGAPFVAHHPRNHLLPTFLLSLFAVIDTRKNTT